MNIRSLASRECTRVIAVINKPQPFFFSPIIEFEGQISKKKQFLGPVSIMSLLPILFYSWNVSGVLEEDNHRELVKSEEINTEKLNINMQTIFWNIHEHTQYMYINRYTQSTSHKHSKFHYKRELFWAYVCIFFSIFLLKLSGFLWNSIRSSVW